MSQAINLAAPFIVGCPSSNPILPVKQYKHLNFTSAGTQAPKTCIVNIEGGLSSTNNWVAFLHGGKVTYTAITNNTVTFPDLIGVVYAVVTNTNSAVNDDTTLAGPVRLNLGLASNQTAPSSN